MSTRLQSLIVSYCSALPLDVQSLAQAITPADDGPGTILASLAEALARVHRIKGAGGSLGFEAVSLAAARLEAHLRAFDAATADDNGVEAGLVLESLAQLKALAATIKPEGSSLHGIDLSRIPSQARRLARAS